VTESRLESAGCGSKSGYPAKGSPSAPKPVPLPPDGPAQAQKTKTSQAEGGFHHAKEQAGLQRQVQGFFKGPFCQIDLLQGKVAVS